MSGEPGLYRYKGFGGAFEWPAGPRPLENTPIFHHCEPSRGASPSRKCLHKKEKWSISNRPAELLVPPNGVYGAPNRNTRPPCSPPLPHTPTHPTPPYYSTLSLSGGSPCKKEPTPPPRVVVSYNLNVGPPAPVPGSEWLLLCFTFQEVYRRNTYTSLHLHKQHSLLFFASRVYQHSIGSRSPPRFLRAKNSRTPRQETDRRLSPFAL